MNVCGEDGRRLDRQRAKGALKPFWREEKRHVVISSYSPILFDLLGQLGTALQTQKEKKTIKERCKVFHDMLGARSRGT